MIEFVLQHRDDNGNPLGVKRNPIRFDRGAGPAIFQWWQQQKGHLQYERRLPLAAESKPPKASK